jgi:hypothetical protein
MRNENRLFIIGAPKSGTTSLYKWLNTSSDVFMGKVKEPRYFCNFRESDFSGPGKKDFFSDHVSTKEQYDRLFEHATCGQILGEASTDYLSCYEAAENIYNSKFKKVKIIIIIRNPVERAFSEYLHTVRDGIEKTSFIDSIKKEISGERIEYQPLFHHIRRGLYVKSLEVYFDKFNAEDILILKNEDLKNNQNAILKKICKFLNIEQISIQESAKHNQSGVPISNFLHSLENPNNKLHKILKYTISQKYLSNLKFKVQKYNLRKPKITRAEWKYAYQFFRDDIEDLEKRLDMNLSNWKYYR